MRLQTLLASLWACISALLLVAHAAPVRPNAEFSSKDVEQFHLASKVLENIQYFTDAYQDFIDKTPNTTDLAIQSFYNQTMVALPEERAEELNMAVGLMNGGLLHGATTVNETIAMLQNYRSLEAFRPNPEQLRMISKLMEQVRKYQESRSGLHVAVLEISPGSGEFRGTIIFNGKAFAPFCDILRCFPHSSCRPCPVRPGEHISITTPNSIPDIVVVNHNFYQPVHTSKKTNSTNSVTQRDLKGKTDTTAVALPKGLPTRCTAWGSSGLLPNCPPGNSTVSGAPSCPKGYHVDEGFYGVRRLGHNQHFPVICTLTNRTEAAHPSENNLQARSLESTRNHDHLRLPRLPHRCAPRNQTITPKGTPPCPVSLYEQDYLQDGPCPSIYIPTYERNVTICLYFPRNHLTNTALDGTEDADHPLAVASLPEFSRRHEDKIWKHPLCRSGMWIDVRTAMSLVCVPIPPNEKVEAYSYENCNETFWGCWGPRRD